MAETEAPELLPCPFCGGVPTIHKHFKEALWQLIHRCRVMGPMIIEWRSSVAALASIWNTRANLAAAEREGLREALKPFAALADHEVVRDALSFGSLSTGDYVVLRLTRGYGSAEISAEAFRAASAALGGGG